MKGKMNAKMGNIIIDRDAQNVLEHVRYKIETFTGMEVEQINVIVEGVRIVDED